MDKDTKQFAAGLLTIFTIISVILFLCFKAVSDDIYKACEPQTTDTVKAIGDTLIIINDTTVKL